MIAFPTTDDYSAEIARLARALSAAPDEISTVAPGPVEAREMALFVEENGEKRLDKLRRSLRLLAGAFDNLEDLFAAFAQEQTWEAGDEVRDRHRFLDWLTATTAVTPEQQDHVACIRARDRVEEKARRDRNGYLRFQERWSVVAELIPEIPHNRFLRVQLNPIHTWAWFGSSALLDAETPPPADVLFYAGPGEVKTAVLEPIGRALVKELAAVGPCSIRHWLMVSQHATPRKLIAVCRDLAEIGLVALT